MDKFFTSTVIGKGLDKFKTDVSFFGGMNPWESVESSLYPLEIASNMIVNIAGFLMMILIF